MLKAVRLMLILLLVTFGVASADEDRTSENNRQLAEWLKKFPAADANKDGVLTFAEARAYRDSRRKNQTSRRADQLRPEKSDVSYGDHPRNRLDFFPAESDKPTPVLIYFHGGGFVGGDKSKVRGLPLTKTCLDNGVSVVSANYRFVRGEDSEPFPGSLLDGVRAVQFVRSKAREWNLDPERVVLSGGSAGGLMSVWIAVHNDFADEASDDVISRQSSRVLGVIGKGAQTTIDSRVILREIGGNPTIHGSVPFIYGIQSRDELKSPQMQAKMEDWSALTHVTADDPPMLLQYGGRLAGTPLPPDTSTGVSIHHATFGELLRKQYASAGAKAEVLVSCADCPDKGSSELAFLRRVLNIEK